MTNSPIIPKRIVDMVATIGRENEFNYTIHICEEFRFVFFSNPICACSTLKASLNLSVANALGIAFEITNTNEIHDRRHNLLKTPSQIGYDKFDHILDDRTWTKFAFVRSPESRFLSVFRKKLMRENRFTSRVRKYLCVDPEVPLDNFLNFEAFAAAVADDSGLRDLDEHWRLQRRQILFDHVPGMALGHVETFGSDIERILSNLFGAGQYVLSDAVKLNPSNASINRPVSVELSKTVVEHIRRAYSQDYPMIGSDRAALLRSAQ